MHNWSDILFYRVEHYFTFSIVRNWEQYSAVVSQPTARSFRIALPSVQQGERISLGRKRLSWPSAAVLQHITRSFRFDLPSVQKGEINSLGRPRLSWPSPDFSQPALPHQDPWSRQSNKDKENLSRDDRHSYPRVPGSEDRHVQKRVLEQDRLGMDSSKKRRNGI